MKLRVADYIVGRLVELGIKDAFLVTGGGAMHLNDAIGRCRSLRHTCFHHEQACAMAAQAYFRLCGRPALVNVTTGPGGTNAITGVYGAWVDSEAMIVLSGQVKWETCVKSTGLALRQLGDQELEITRLVEPITKLARMVTEPERIRYELERAVVLATTGRPGPVWLDIPMNVQGALIDSEDLPGYDPSEDAPVATADLDEVVPEVARLLGEAERPVILGGSGIRISGQYQAFFSLIEALKVPVVTAFNAHDLLTWDHPLYVGRPGTVGDRPGNFAVQNADLVLVLGCRLNIRQIGYGYATFARAARIVMVDIDRAELDKPTLRLHTAIHADLCTFLPRLTAVAASARRPAHRAYLDWCRARLERYPVVRPEYRTRECPVNPYLFVEALFDVLPLDAVVTTANGTACVVTFQAAKIRGSQRLFSDSGSAPMGFDLPSAIGASLAGEGRLVVTLAGDGSIMMNLQELQTVATHRLNIKLFILNNSGYHSIRQTQRAFFPDAPIGFDADTGVGFPDFGRVAAAFGLPFERISSHSELSSKLGWVIEQSGPVVCEVMLDPEQAFAPKAASRRLPDGRMVSSPLEDLAPFLPRDELRQNLLIPALEDDA